MGKTAFFRDSRLHVPVTWLEATPGLLHETSVRNLAAENQVSMGFASTLPLETELVEESPHEGYVALPRGFLAHPLVRGAGDVERLPWEGRQDGCPRFPAPLRQPRDEDQALAVDALHAAYEADEAGGAMLEMGCGRGKTTILLLLAARVSRRTLIVVDRSFLLEQWVNEIVATLGIPRDEIGVIQGAHGSTLGDQVTVAMIHTLVQNPEIVDLDLFGLVGLDETHVLSAPSFLSFIPRVMGFRVGLTATVERQDGLHPCFLWHLGGPRPAYSNVMSRQPATWVVHETPAYLSSAEAFACTRGIPGRYRTERDERGRKAQVQMRALVPHKLDAKLLGRREWVAQLARVCKDAVDRGRRVLVLTGSVGLCEKLTEALGLEGVDARCVVGKTGKKDRLIAFEEAQVLVATEQLAGKGLDMKNLSVLVLDQPNLNPGFLRQAKGRCDRAEDCAPVVHFFAHRYIPSLSRKADKMIPIIQEIDPGARVVYRKAGA